MHCFVLISQHTGEKHTGMFCSKDKEVLKSLGYNLSPSVFKPVLTYPLTYSFLEIQHVASK